MEQVRVASIFPMPRGIYKPRFTPQNRWDTPPVKKGAPPAVIYFNDQREKVYRGDDGRGNKIETMETIYAHEIANDFIKQNTNMAFCDGSAHPGLWIVDSLGEDTSLLITGAANGTATILRFSEPHGLTVPSNVTISGAIGYWGILNAAWMATPISEDTLSIPVDSTQFGEFTSAGTGVTIHVRRHLTLEQEAAIMRPIQDAFFRRWINDARKWAAKKEFTRIVHTHHVAAEALGIKGEDWQQNPGENSQAQCQYCRQHIPSDAVVCPQCTRIVNVAAYARLQAEEKAAMAAAGVEAPVVPKKPIAPVQSADLKQELQAMATR